MIEWINLYYYYAYIIILELALLNNKPRAATIYAKGRLKCATLNKKAFNRLLGPVVDIIKRNTVQYKRSSKIAL